MPLVSADRHIASSFGSTSAERRENKKSIILPPLDRALDEAERKARAELIPPHLMQPAALGHHFDGTVAVIFGAT